VAQRGSPRRDRLSCIVPKSFTLAGGKKLEPQAREPRIRASATCSRASESSVSFPGSATAVSALSAGPALETGTWPQSAAGLGCAGNHGLGRRLDADWPSRRKPFRALAPSELDDSPMVKPDPEQRRCISTHLEKALEMSRAEHPAWLTSLVAQDPELAGELGVLLQEHTRSVEQRLVGPTTESSPEDNVPRVASYSAPGVGMLLGRYRLVRKIGEGGMGAVYEAMHLDLGKRAAIKTLHAQYAESAQGRLRFLLEGQAASRIRHPNVADVYDVGTEGDCPFLVMELLEGEDLAHLLARERPLTVHRTADLLAPVAAAIAAAHDQGVVHRDLKPENIFLSVERSGVRPKVLDFGISKVIDAGAVLALTDTGMFLGTPFYVSPEQARGAKSIDVRADQYSLGVILYECVTGRRPIEDSSIYALVQRIAHGDFPSPREINASLPGAFEDLILRAMAVDPNDRFPTTTALAESLLEFASPGVRIMYGSGDFDQLLETGAYGARPAVDRRPSVASTPIGVQNRRAPKHILADGARQHNAPIPSFERPNTHGARIRGSLFAHIPRFVKEHFGLERWSEFLGRLDPVATQAYATDMEPLAWYPFRVVASAVDAIVDMSEDVQAESTLIKLARHNLDSATTLIFRAIFKTGSPEFMVSRSKQVWKKYYSSGQMRVVYAEKGKASVQLVDFPEMTSNYNRGVLYGIGFVIVKAGGHITRQEITRNTCRGDELNEYTYTWR
jgi:Protein kinase domain